MFSSVMLLTALVLAPVIGGGFGELSTSILELLIIAAFAWNLTRSGEGENAWPRIPGIVPLAVFLLAVFISTIFTEAVYLSLKHVLFVCACIGAYAVACALCRDSRVAAAAVWGIAMSALVICMIGVRDYVIGAGGGTQFWKSLLGAGTHTRLFGPFLNPGFFAGFLVISIPVALGLYLVTRRTVLALLAGTALVIQILAVMLTGTKFGIVAAAAALLLVFTVAVFTGSLRHSRFRRLIAMALVLAPLLYLFRGPVVSRIAAAEFGGTQVHSTTFRIYTWKATLGMIARNPWLGVGPGAFEVAYPRYTIAGPTKYAHQSYLQVASESGVVALIALVAAIGVIAWRTLAGTLRGAAEHTEPAKAREETAAPVGEITWKDLVPFSGWRMMNCAMFAALAGCTLRNLVDSDWYLAGIAIPFWILAGTLAAQSGAAKGVAVPSRRVRAALIGLCAVLAVAAISFGLGDLLAPDEMQPAGSNAQILRAYERASFVSPLDPRYHRELAKYLYADDRPEAALREMGIAIRLSPTDAINYYIRGSIHLRSGRPVLAAADFVRTLKRNPNSTNALLQLALARRTGGDVAGSESALRRLIRVENSPYEQVKGAPELVDTTFAYAHAYFGRKYLNAKNYRKAADEFARATERLERWQSSGVAIEIGRVMGTLDKARERELQMLRRDCYFGLADAYAGMGDKAKARSIRMKGQAIDVTL